MIYIYIYIYTYIYIHIHKLYTHTFPRTARKPSRIRGAVLESADELVSNDQSVFPMYIYIYIYDIHIYIYICIYLFFPSA